MGQADATRMLKEYKARGLNSQDTACVIDHFEMEPAETCHWLIVNGTGYMDGGGIHFDESKVLTEDRAGAPEGSEGAVLAGYGAKQ